MNSRLIVALDVDTEKKALGIVRELKSAVKLFKVGSELFTSCGPGIIDKIHRLAAGVFLDLKFHDIPNTVRKSALAAIRPGVFMFNVHASGGYDMMKKAAMAVKEGSKARGIKAPKVIAVTVLTSMDQNTLNKVGVSDNIKIQVLRLANLAKTAGLDGVVASPQEVRLIRKSTGKNFLIVTPGVRPSWAAMGGPSAGSGSSRAKPSSTAASRDDQKRVAAPSEAIKDGADFIVVGRPIIEAPSPLKAARDVLKEMNSK